MRTALLVACAAAACVALPAAAQEAGAPAAEAKPKKEKLICRVETPTGSRTRSNRTCLTESQWREVSTSAKQDVDGFTRRTIDAQSRPGPSQ